MRHDLVPHEQRASPGKTQFTTDHALALLTELPPSCHPPQEFIPFLDRMAYPSSSSPTSPLAGRVAREIAKELENASASAEAKLEAEVDRVSRELRSEHEVAIAAAIAKERESAEGDRVLLLRQAQEAAEKMKEQAVSKTKRGWGEGWRLPPWKQYHFREE